MAWLCVNEDRQEIIVDEKPERVNKEGGYGYWKQIHSELPGIEFGDELGVNIPSGTIKRLVGKDITWKDEPVEYLVGAIKSEKKKIINWRILALSIIWSLLLICLSDFAVSREGNWKWIAIGLVTIVISFVFYFGYKDVDIDSSYTEDEKDFFGK